LNLPDAEYLRLQGEVTRHLANRDNCRTALQEAERLVGMRPHDAIALNLKGSAHYCLQEVDRAFEAFDAATQNDPGYRSAQYNKAAALVRLGNYARAGEILEKLLASDSGYASARYNLALAQAAQGKYSDALANFQAVDRSASGFDVSLGLGFMYALDASGASEQKSLEYFRKAMTVKPGAVCVLYAALPVDPELAALKPYATIARAAEQSAPFRSVREKFDAQHSAVACNTA
jgi:tetratricopeptide (TPR) repeat protein